MTRAYRLTLQTDGNLVLRCLDDRTLPLEVSLGSYGGALWASDTNGQPVNRCEVQDDGNLVLYDAAGNVRWAAGTSGSPYGLLCCQDDGNVVLYGNDLRPLWHTDTFCGPR